MSSSGRALVLRLPSEINESTDWTVVADYFVETFLPKHEKRLSQTVSGGTAGKGLRHVNVCHARMKREMRDNTSYQNNEQLVRCLKAFSLQVFLAPVVQSIKEDLTKTNSAAAIEEEEDDLFTYADNSTDQQQAVPFGPVEELLGCLEALVPQVSNAFLQDLFVAFDGEIDLALLLVRRLLDRLHSSPSTQILSGRMNAISNLLELSPSAMKVVALQVTENVGACNGLTGRGLEEQLPLLAPIFSSCAFSVPQAGSERGTSNRSLPIRQMMEIPEFPTCIFNPAQCSTYNKVRDDSRRSVESFRNTAGLTVKRLFRTAGKDNVFQWLQHIIVLK
ncbi:MAG: hypothetical protein SGILL_005361 [Bacillariaceae sp.]